MVDENYHRWFLMRLSDLTYVPEAVVSIERDGRTLKVYRDGASLCYRLVDGGARLKRSAGGQTHTRGFEGERWDGDKESLAQLPSVAKWLRWCESKFPALSRPPTRGPTFCNWSEIKN